MCSTEFHTCQQRFSRLTISVSILVFSGELLSDWVKHSFITKFNRLKSTIYSDFSLVLSADITGKGHENVNLDHTHAIVKRVGLAQIPFCVVVIRFVIEAGKYSEWYQKLTRKQTIMRGVIGFASLCCVELLLGWSVDKIARWVLRDEGTDDGIDEENENMEKLNSSPSAVVRKQSLKQQVQQQQQH